MMLPALLLLFALQEDVKPPCSTDIRWISGAQKIVTRDVQVIPLTLFSSVSLPTDCLTAEIRVTVSYFDAEDNILCSGVIENVAVQSAHTQMMNIEIRPWTTLEYIVWRNGPRPTAVRPKRLLCMNPDGLAEVSITELDRALSIRIYATALPNRSGVSSAEMRLRIQP